MSIFNYFSSNPDVRAKYIFNLIAPYYGRVDHVLQGKYQKTFEILKDKCAIEGASVLDVGTGTGAWAAMYEKHGLSDIQAVDFAPKMLFESQKKYPNIKFSIGNAEELSEFPDQSMDIVTASYVLHGVTSEKRAKMLSEMSRVARKYVIINDFIGKTPAFVRFLEFMEKSDYKHFKLHFEQEMQPYFNKSERIFVEYGTGLYIGHK
jgi:ubiquinone/menaquinone biosynthesis C-methylase UbiE